MAIPRSEPKDRSLLNTGEGGDVTLVWNGKYIVAIFGLAHHGSKLLAKLASN